MKLSEKLQRALALENKLVDCENENAALKQKLQGLQSKYDDLVSDMKEYYVLKSTSKKDSELKKRLEKFKWLSYNNESIRYFKSGTYGFIDAKGTNYYGIVKSKNGLTEIALSWIDDDGVPHSSAWLSNAYFYESGSFNYLPNFVKFRQMHKWIDPATDKERKRKEVEQKQRSKSLIEAIPETKRLYDEDVLKSPPQNNNEFVPMKSVVIPTDCIKRYAEDYTIIVDVIMPKLHMCGNPVGHAEAVMAANGILVKIELRNEFAYLIANGTSLYPHVFGKELDGYFHILGIELWGHPQKEGDPKLELQR